MLKKFKRTSLKMCICNIFFKIEVPLELRAAPLKVLLRSLRPKFSILGVSLAPLTEGPLLSKILGFGDRTFLWEDPFNQNTIPI